MNSNLDYWVNTKKMFTDEMQVSPMMTYKQAKGLFFVFAISQNYAFVEVMNEMGSVLAWYNHERDIIKKAIEGALLDLRLDESLKD